MTGLLHVTAVYKQSFQCWSRDRFCKFHRLRYFRSQKTMSLSGIEPIPQPVPLRTETVQLYKLIINFIVPRKCNLGQSFREIYVFIKGYCSNLISNSVASIYATADC